MSFFHYHMPKISSIILAILSVIIGAVFLYSSFTKSYTTQSFESFEFTIIEYVHLPWVVTAFIARFFIGLEATIGALMVLNIYGKNKWVLKLAILLLIAFSLYLAFLWIFQGNDINCGCFGDAIWMSPSSSLIKNAIMLLCIYPLLRFHQQLPFRWSNILAILALVVMVYVPFNYFDISDTKPDWIKKDHYQIDLSALYATGKTDIPTVNLQKGKYIIAFFSPGCPHCRIAAYKMHILKQNDPSLPFFMVIGGKKDLTDFWKNTKAQNIPYCRLDEKPFFKIAGYRWPVIFWINNNWVEAKSNQMSLDETAIKDWLIKP